MTRSPTYAPEDELCLHSYNPFTLDKFEGSGRVPQGISSVVLPILARGVGIGGMVWAAFGVPERVLNEDTELKIGIWLLDVNRDLQSSIKTWPDTFASLFDRVFGERHLSWKCFSHSAMASYFALVVTGFYLEGIRWELLPSNLFDTFRYGFIGNVPPDYVSLLETRYVMSLMQGRNLVGPEGH